LWSLGPKKEEKTVNITVVKRNGDREPYDANKINLAIEEAAKGLEDSIAWVTQIASELELTLFDGITTQQLDEAVIQVALQNIKDDPAFDIVGRATAGQDHLQARAGRL
jgi:ribonucleoside-diphosphate reductase alpha chain